METFLSAAALLLIGGALSLVAQFVQRKWTRDDGRAARDEEREARRTDEDRTNRRAYREERAKPILEFVNLAREHLGIVLLDNWHNQAVEKGPSIQEMAARMGVSEDVVRGLLVLDKHQILSGENLRERTGRVLRSCYGAATIAPTSEIREAIIATLESLQQGEDDGSIKKLADLVDDYRASNHAQ